MAEYVTNLMLGNKQCFNRFFNIKWACLYTALRHIMAHASNWHKTKVKILNNNGSLSPTLVHFCFTNKEVEVTTEII